MRQVSKKVISVILSFCILLGVFSVPAFAEESEKISVDVTLEADKVDYTEGESITFSGSIVNSSSADCAADIEFDIYATPAIDLNITALTVDALAAGESRNLKVEATAARIVSDSKIIQFMYDFFTGYVYTYFISFVSALSASYECVKIYIDNVPACIVYKVDSSVSLNGTDSKSVYKVSFDLNCETEIETPATQRVKAGTKATEPLVEREGYQLIGWYTSPSGFSGIFDFSQTVDADLKLYARWYDENDTKDSDDDGLVDSIEEQFGSDPTSVDTDSDGVDDYNELNWLNIDPSEIDSDGDGINDGREDADGDKLSNAKESSLGTNPAYEDTDFDLLSDYDEVMVCYTDPLNEDTDGDGAKDGAEAMGSSDPLKIEEGFVTSESTGKADSENPVSASAMVVTDGEGAGTLKIEEVTNSDNPLLSASIPGYLGSAYDFSTEGEFESAVITFEFDKSLGEESEDFQPRIYYLNEETGELEELPDQMVGEGFVSVSTSHFSTYILLNKKDFDAAWDKEIKPVDYKGDGKTGVDIVFVVDSSGSMDWNDGSNIRHLAVRSFVDKLGENDRAAVVDFDNYSTVYQNFTSDHTLLYNAISRVDSSGGTSLSAGMSSAISLFTSSSYTRTDAYKYIIFLTDGDGSYSTSYTNSAKSNDIVVYTVGLGPDVQTSVLKAIAEGTGGKYYFASAAGDLPDIYSEVSFETIDYTTDSNNDGISDYYTNLLNDGKLLLSNGSAALTGVVDKYGADCADWDNDGLLNGEEIATITTSYGTYVRMTSHPLMTDSDADKLNDFDEVKKINTNPLKKTKIGGLSVETLLDSDSYVYVEQTTSKTVASCIAGFFDWQKTNESKDFFINYFYDYASEESINENAEEIKTQLKREKAWEIVETIASVIKLGKNTLDLGTDLASYDSVVKGQVTRYNNSHKSAIELFNEKKYDDIIEKYGAPDELSDSADTLKNIFDISSKKATVDKINAGVSAASSAIKLISALNKVKISLPESFDRFARKYQTWLKKSPAGGFKGATKLSVACSAISLVTDIGSLANTYGKLQANSEAFSEYIEIIEYAALNGNDKKYVKVAAGDVVKIVLDESGEEYYNQLGEAISKKTFSSVLTIGVALVGDVCPYVKVAQGIVALAEVLISITGMTAIAKNLVILNCADSISDGCCSYLKGIVDLEDVFYSYDEENENKVNMYLTQLAQIRIVGESEVYESLNNWSLSHFISKLITGSNKKEIEELMNTKLKTIYYDAETLKLPVSKKLPGYPKDYLK